MNLVPLFPLPNVVLFPEVPLFLHVFEPRYRALVTDALASHRMIGMTVLKPGHEADYEGRPPIYPLGCRGAIVEEQRLEDGRFNIVLQGVRRFRVLEEREGAPYRVGVVEDLEDPAGEDGRLAHVRQELLSGLERLTDGSKVVTQGEVSTAMLVNAVCQGLELPAVEKLDLLACDSIETRARRLLDLVAFHKLERDLGRPSRAN